jgi:membrane associated rhomboid family serine protease
MLPLRDQLPTRTPAAVNYTLITLNLVVFGLEALGVIGGANGDATVLPGSLVPAHLVGDPRGSWYTLFTHMFLHGGWGHVGGNMLFLWIFGDNVEDALGHGRYLLFYLICGLAAAMAQVAISPHSTVPMVGASGAIAGVLAAYALLYPRSPITVLNPIPILWLFWGLFIYLPAWFVIVGWFAVQLWNAFQPSSGGSGVAFVAHIGGFLTGLILSPLLRKRDPVEHDVWQRVAPPRRRYGEG